MSVEARLEDIRDRVERAVRRSGREPDSVRLVAVSKTRSAEEIDAAARAGVTDIGENKVQEAEAKKPLVTTSPRWHLIGHLQKNKAKKAVQLFDWIHSVDSVSLGERIDRIAGEDGKAQSVLVQVDLAGEDTKHGLPEAELFTTLEYPELGAAIEHPDFFAKSSRCRDCASMPSARSASFSAYSGL